MKHAMHGLKKMQPLFTPLRYLLTGVLLIYLVWAAEPLKIWEAAKGASLPLLALAVVLQGAGVALSSAKWGALLSARGQPQPYPWLLSVYLVGQFANNFLPTGVGGDAVRAMQLGRRIGSFSQSSASVFIDRLTGFLALSLIANVALVLSYTGIGGERLETAGWLYLLSIGFTLAGIGAVALCLVAPWLQKLPGNRLPEAVRGRVAQITTALAAYLPQGRWLALVLALSLLFQSLWFIINAVCGAALGIQAPLIIYALMAPLTDMLGLLPVFVNNMGARELVFTLYLAQVGVDPATALALAFVVLSVRIVVSILGGLVMLFGGASLREVKEPPPSAPAPAPPGKTS